MNDIIKIITRLNCMSQPPLRFLVFQIEAYYPTGGWDDLHATTNDKEAVVPFHRTARFSYRWP